MENHDNQYPEVPQLLEEKPRCGEKGNSYILTKLRLNSQSPQNRKYTMADVNLTGSRNK